MDADLLSPALHKSRFLLVAVAGGSLALFGIVANGLLCKLFVSRLNFRKSPFFFLGFVALFDTLLDAVYILLMTPPILAEYFSLPWLYIFWLPRARWLFLLGQVFKTASCFNLIVASFERYRMTRHWTFSGFEQRERWLLLGCAVGLALLIRGPSAGNVVVVMNGHERDIFRRYTIGLSGGGGGRGGEATIKDWLPSFLHLLTVIVPFGTLVFLNTRIVMMLRHQNVQQLRSLIAELTVGHDIAKLRRRQLRAATNTLLVIISAYLLSNLPNLFLSIAEYLSPGHLQRTYPHQYRLASDFASLLTVFGNALRFPAHFCSNREVRKQLKLMLFSSTAAIKRMANQHERTSSIKSRRKPSSIACPGGSYLNLRRLSDRLVESPWFSALLTTPRMSQCIGSNDQSPTCNGNGNGHFFLSTPNAALLNNLTIKLTEEVEPVEPLKTTKLSKLSLDGSLEENVYSCEDGDGYAYVDETERGSTNRTPIAAALGNQHWRRYMLTDRSREPRGGPLYTRLDLDNGKLISGDSVESTEAD